MGKTITSTSYQTPRAKGRRRSSLLGLGKMLGKLGKMGKKMLGPASYGSRRVSSCLKSVNSPAAQRRRSGNCMAERTVYREVRKERLNNYLVREGVENIKWRRGVSPVAKTPRGFKYRLGKVITRGKRIFVTPAKHKPRYFKQLTPDKLVGGWRGDLADFSQEWEVFVLDTNVLMHNLGVVENLLECDGPLIYIAAIVQTELDGLKRSKKLQERHQARRGNDWLQEALGLGDRKIVKIATQTVLEEEEAKSRWPQEISGLRRGDNILLATCKWLVDVKGVQADKAVLVTDDKNLYGRAIANQLRVCRVQYLESKISSDDSIQASPNGLGGWQDY